MNLFIICELSVPDNLFDNRTLGKTLFVSVLDRGYRCRKRQLLPCGCAFVHHYFRNARCKIPTQTTNRQHNSPGSIWKFRN